MADTYLVEGQEPAVTSSLQTMMGLTASTLTRARISEWEVGAGDPTFDEDLEFTIQRYTTAPTFGTTVTPAPMDIGAPVAQLAAGEAASAEGVQTAVLYKRTVNARSSYRWTSLKDDSDIIVPAVSSDGVGIRVLATAYVGIAQGNYVYTE